MNQEKLKIGLIFGGRSFEHEVSLVSARSILNALDKNKYKIKLFGITKEGYWVQGKTAKKLLKGKEIKRKRRLSLPKSTKEIDIFFPVLHGPFGEDGTIQGLLESIRKPYVGADVLGSALGMDKVAQKIIWENYKLPITKFKWFLKKDWEYKQKTYIENIEKTLGYPCFVKPANSGSSVGISKAKNKNELIKGVYGAARYDNKVIIEKAVPNARDIEVSILGNDNPAASLPGEVIPSNEFYDYESKYIKGATKEIIPAKLPKETIAKLQKIAIKAYRAIECKGMGRADFLIPQNTDEIFLNEINTLPGFTSISMYPKLWQASGLTYSKLLDKLIKLGLKRFRNIEQLHFSYKPKIKWHAK
ncbi:MAG TPA: D-alanine--D-alanine ligase family protein [Patescibacteria group bacterium]|nr:D-alanine--D-alanine ligase family protein [Patescibacteria group bacterium]